MFVAQDGPCTTHHSSTLFPTYTSPRREHIPLLTSREELPSLLVSLYKHWSSLLQKQATVLGWSTDDKLVLTSVARISRVHASGDVGVHCKLPFSVQRKRDLSVWESCLLCGQCNLASNTWTTEVTLLHLRHLEFHIIRYPFEQSWDPQGDGGHAPSWREATPAEHAGCREMHQGRPL